MRVLWKGLGTVLVTYIPRGPTLETSSSGMLTGFCWGRPGQVAGWDVGPLPAPHFLSPGEVQFQALARRGRQTHPAAPGQCSPNSGSPVSVSPGSQPPAWCPCNHSLTRGTPPLQLALGGVKSPGGQA